MRLRILFLLFVCSTTTNIFGQGKVMTVDEAEKEKIPFKNYKVAVSISNKNAVFYGMSDSVINSFQGMLQNILDYLDQQNFKWNDTMLVFNKVYFDKSGKIDYYTYRILSKKGITPEQEKKFQELLTTFIQTYRFPMKGNDNFSQVSEAVFMDKPKE
ncbi:MAG TPA: hypothetical protein VN721_05630 [Flavipsychrobacter sp.]|nr:hypothetical protein [Flavipsychrobacter sp.]